MQINQTDFCTVLESLIDVESAENRTILDCLEDAHYPISNFSMAIAFLDSLKFSDCNLWTSYWVENPLLGENAFKLKRSMIEAQLNGVVNLVHATVSNFQFGLDSKQQNRCLAELAEILMLISITLYHEREIPETARRAKELAVLISEGLPDHSPMWTLVDPIESRGSSEANQAIRSTSASAPDHESHRSELLQPWVSHGRRVLLKSDGTAVDSHSDSAAWHHARRISISASDAGKLVKLNGQESRQRDALLRSKILDERGAHFGSYDLGIEREPEIALWVQANFPEIGFIHNRNLYIGVSERHTATPDMVGKDVLCEIKVSNKELTQIRTKYRDQMQWQMHVTAATSVLFVVEDRETQEIEYEWIQRDQDRIDTLVEAANHLLSELDEALGAEEIAGIVSSSDTLVGYSELDSNKDASGQESIDFLEIEEVSNDRELKFMDEGRVVELYLSGLNVWGIAQALGVEAKDVGRILAIKFLSQVEPLVDEGAVNFGQSWTDEDAAALKSCYLSGLSIGEIADKLGRDKLGVCFRVLEAFAPELRKANHSFLGAPLQPYVQ